MQLLTFNESDGGVGGILNEMTHTTQEKATELKLDSNITTEALLSCLHTPSQS